MNLMSKKETTDVTSVSGFKDFLSHKIWVKLGMFVLVAMGTQAAQAACPAIDVLSELKTVSTGLPIVYFCKQDFTSDKLKFTPSQTDLVKDGSQHRAMTNTIQSFPMSNSINLAGFTPDQLNLNKLRSDFPTIANPGTTNSKNIFNFFTAIASVGNCKDYFGANQFEIIRTYLRSNPSVFRANGGTQQAVPLTNGDDLAVIKDVVVGHTTQSNSPIIADITFYHTNYSAGGNAQFFTRALRFCWVGVSTRMDIKTDTNPPKYSGDYTVDVGVLTQ